MITYKDLYSYVISEIDKRSTYSTNSKYSNQLSRNLASVSPDANRTDISTAELMNGVRALLAESLPSYIVTGLQVSATTPISNKVIVSAGKGTAGGRLYEISEDTTLVIPFDGYSEVFYINLYKDTLLVERAVSTDKLCIAKVVSQVKNASFLIQDTRDTSNQNAYIVNFKEYKLYGFNDKFEEDTIELLRDNIGEILADNLIGNIRLSENMKIINTSGTLELNSDSLLMSDLNGNLLVELNPNGIYFNRADGVELAKFSTSGARIGNIVILPNAIQSDKFLTGVRGFSIFDSGDAEFNDIYVRGEIDALTGTIGGWTIASNALYATTTGTIKTSLNAGMGANGVVLDKDGMRIYDDVLGIVVNLPSDGSAPTFSSGIINNTIFNIQTSAVLRTSETVGDGSADSWGLLMNSSGLYGCGANQFLSDANFKILADGNAYFKGNVQSTSGEIANVTITPDALTGGLIVGTLIRGATIETSASVPRIRMDANGIYYQLTTNVGTYGAEGSGLFGFLYGDGTVYGTGITAYLFHENYPVLAITSELQDTADIRLYNRIDIPTSGEYEVGDLIVVDGSFMFCVTAGSPGIFQHIPTSSGTTGGTGSAGSGKQYVELKIDGTTYKVLHDGAIT